MKKILISLAVVTIVSTLCVSCKKETAGVTSASVPPVQAGSVEELINGVTPQVAKLDSKEEIGIYFSSAVAGNIKSVKIHLPNTGNYEITLWKADDESVITRVPIIQTHTAGWKDSIEVNTTIQAGVDYVLSVTTNNFYYIETPASTLPYTHGDITVRAFGESFGTGQEFPTIPFRNSLAGFIDFTFQRLK